MRPDPGAGAVDALVARFTAAAERAGLHEVDLRMATHRVRLRFAGAGLMPVILPALSHLQVPRDGPADLTVHLWDTRSTGTEMIDAPWDMRVLEFGGAIPEATAQGLYAIYHLEEPRLVVLDPPRGRAVMWIHDAARVPWYERAAPLRATLAAYFARHGKVMTHAGAVAHGGHGVLLGGSGGSGKSSTALTCLQAGFDYGGDDFVLTEPEARGHPMAYSLYATGKVFVPDTRHFADITPAFAGEPPPGEKATAFLQRQSPERLSPGFPLVALLLPMVSGNVDTRAEPMKGAHALRGLAPSTVFQHDGLPRPMLAALARLVARLPCFRLELGTNRDEIPVVIADLIGRCR